jgi:hypothetical protein
MLSGSAWAGASTVRGFAAEEPGVEALFAAATADGAVFFTGALFMGEAAGVFDGETPGIITAPELS